MSPGSAELFVNGWLFFRWRNVSVVSDLQEAGKQTGRFIDSMKVGECESEVRSQGDLISYELKLQESSSATSLKYLD